MFKREGGARPKPVGHRFPVTLPVARETFVPVGSKRLFLFTLLKGAPALFSPCNQSTGR